MNIFKKIKQFFTSDSRELTEDEKREICKNIVIEVAESLTADRTINFTSVKGIRVEVALKPRYNEEYIRRNIVDMREQISTPLSLLVEGDTLKMEYGFDVKYRSL